MERIIGRDKGEIIKKKVYYVDESRIHSEGTYNGYFLDGDYDSDGDCIIDHNEGFTLTNGEKVKLPELDDKKRYLYASSREVSIIETKG